MKASKKVKNPTGQPYQVEKHLRKFCNVTSQELGHVLGAIVGELDYALSGASTTERDRSMRVALNAAERALNLSRNLRYFAVHTRLDVHTADISQVLLDTVDMLEKEFETRKIEMSVLAEAATYATIDEGAIQQVIRNLLSNASHAMPQGGKIKLSLRRLKQMIEIRCTDTGVGIPPENVEHVFEPYFFTAQGSLAENQGLGLAVTKALVEAHGGEISLESSPVSGTTFTVLIPCGSDTPVPFPFREKRRFRRVNVTLPVQILVEGNPPLLTDLNILSVGGCFVRLPNAGSFGKAERNQVLRLRINYYNDEIIEITRARVASQCRVGDHLGVGVEFLEMDAKAKTMLLALVKSYSS